MYDFMDEPIGFSPFMYENMLLFNKKKTSVAKATEGKNSILKYLYYCFKTRFVTIPSEV